MDETPPETTHEPAPPASSPNGTNPLPDLGPELRRALSAFEEIDMRLQSIQVACALIVGITLLGLVLQVKDLRG